MERDGFVPFQLRLSILVLDPVRDATYASAGIDVMLVCLLACSRKNQKSMAFPYGQYSHACLVGLFRVLKTLKSPINGRIDFWSVFLCPFAESFRAPVVDKPMRWRHMIVGSGVFIHRTATKVACNADIVVINRYYPVVVQEKYFTRFLSLLQIIGHTVVIPVFLEENMVIKLNFCVLEGLMRVLFCGEWLQDAFFGFFKEFPPAVG